MSLISSFLVFLTLVGNVYTGNILFFTNLGSYSHRVVLYPLANALSNQGHNVTLISPFHPKHTSLNPNITEIVPTKLAETMEAFLKAEFDINFRIKKTMPRNIFQFIPTMITGCEAFLESSEFSDYLKRTEKLDLLIADHTGGECAMIFSHLYKVKHIVFSTVTMIAWEHDVYGLVPESSSIPELEIFPPRVPMSFLERVENTLVSIHARYEYFKYVGRIDNLIRNFMKQNNFTSLEETMPFTDDLWRNASLMFFTGDWATSIPRSLPPMVVNVGGLHCKIGKDQKELPQNIRDFLKDDDFVYISLGSVVISSNLPEKIRQMFFQMIDSYPNLKFLWKWNGPQPEDIPKNLFLSKWFPQVDILANPNIKAFVTQSGRPSVLESLCNGVPTIAFPVLGDQDANANRLNDMGGNVLLDIASITKEKLQDAVKMAAFDHRMRNRVKELQKIVLDRPMPPLDTAVWWVEYVLRHTDTSHLRSAGFNETWFQRRLLDVWIFLFIALAFCLIVTSLVLVKILKLMSKMILLRIMNRREMSKAQPKKNN